MEDPPEQHQFACPQCSQVFKSTYEQIGLEMACLQCGYTFQIPDFSGPTIVEDEIEPNQGDVPMQGIQPHAAPSSPHPDLMQSFTNESIQLLQSRQEIDFTFLSMLHRQNCWEFAIIAYMLNSKVETLKQSVCQKKYVQLVSNNWNKKRFLYKRFLKEHSIEMFALLESLQITLSNSFKEMCLRGDIRLIFQFIDEIDQLLGRLQGFHEKFFDVRMPKEEPYLGIQRIFTAWVPYCSKNLSLFAEKLRDDALKQRDEQIILPQISFVPPLIYTLISQLNGLGIGFDRPRTVIEDKV